MAFVQNKLTTNVDTIDESIGFKLPFTFELVNMSKTSLESVQTNLKSLLNTRRGERLFQPNLGIDIKKYLFEQMVTPESYVAIQEEIIEQVAIWLPFLNIENINVDLKPSDNLLSISITYSFKSNSNLSDSVQVNVNTGVLY